jgi:hypothetical protein
LLALGPLPGEAKPWPCRRLRRPSPFATAAKTTDRESLRRHGAADVEALHLSDAAFARDQRQLLAGLDALDGHRQVEFGAEGRDAIEQAQRATACLQAVQERAIDLHLVERETVQVAETGIAGAEIIERNAHAQILQLIEPQARDFAIVEKGGLGDFDLQAIGSQLGRLQRLADGVSHVVAAELNGG